MTPKALGKLKLLRPFTQQEMVGWVTSGPGSTRAALESSKPVDEDTWIRITPTILMSGEGQVLGSCFHLAGEDKRLTVNLRAAGIWPDLVNTPKNLKVQLSIDLKTQLFVGVGPNRNMTEWRWVQCIIHQQPLQSTL